MLRMELQQHKEAVARMEAGLKAEIARWEEKHSDLENQHLDLKKQHLDLAETLKAGRNDVLRRQHSSNMKSNLRAWSDRTTMLSRHS